MIENPFGKKMNHIDNQINRTAREMDLCPDSNSEEYLALLARFERLNALKVEDRKGGVSPDAVLAAAGTLLSILTIVAYEQKHVMVSKAFNLITNRK